MNRMFEPFTLKNICLKNRVVMPPMCMYSAKDGYANEWHYTHYGTRAVGGVGLIIIEAAGIVSEGRITTKDLGLWEDAQVEPLKKIVEFNHKQAGVIGIQIGHAGRKSVIFKEDASAPSAIAFDEDSPVPHAMDQVEIDRVVKAFGESARRADEAGFDVLEIHGAHGYLINEFLSPLCNQRIDNYGGTLENRFRFLGEVIEVVKVHWPSEKVLMLRLSAEEYHKNGSNLLEKAIFASMAKKLGVDIVDVSSGGVVLAEMPVYPGYQVRFSQYIKEEADIPTITGGWITTEEQVQEILCNERADLVFMGRELLRNPYFVLNTKASIKGDISWPIPYERGKPS